MVISTWWVKGKFGLYLAAGTEWPPLGVFSLVHEFLMMVFSSHLMLKCKVSDPLPDLLSVRSRMLELIGSGFQHHVEVPRNPSVTLRKYYTCSSKWAVPVSSRQGHGDDRLSKASAPNRKFRIFS